MGQIIQFPRRFPATRPSFGDWLTEATGGKWYVVKQRSYKRGWRGIPWPSGTVLLLEREYRAYEREYEAKFGPI